MEPQVIVSFYPKEASTLKKQIENRKTELGRKHLPSTDSWLRHDQLVPFSVLTLEKEVGATNLSQHDEDKKK